MKTYLYIFLSFSLNMVFAQTMTLDDFTARFNEELDKISATRKQETDSLNVKYLGALLRLETKAKTSGNLTLLQAVRAEVTRIEEGRALDVFGEKPPEELAHMQQVMETLAVQYRKEEAEQVVGLVEKLKDYAQSRVTEATRQNQISNAVAWQGWVDGLADNETVQAAYSLTGTTEQASGNGGDEESAEDMHAALKGRPAKIETQRPTEYSDYPKAYKSGFEPLGKEKRIRSSTPSMQGAGNTKLTGAPKLIEEKDIQKSGYSNNLKEKSYVYVPRLAISPLVGKRLDRTLVVFDLFKRGTGSKRSIIRTDSIVLPPLSAGEQVVVDAGKYEYEVEEYDSSWSSFDYKESTADEFYGFIVTIFDKQGNMIYQRSSERILDDFARKQPPE